MDRIVRWHLLCAAAFLACLCLAAAGLADEDSKPGKGKGKEKEASGTVQIDLSKLPPDLAKQLRKYVKGKHEEEKAAAETKKEKKGKTATAKKGTRRLPPGLARKAADHPGRVAWLKAHGGEQQAPATKKGKGRKHKDEDD